MELTERAEFLVEHLNIADATGVPTAEWEHFQLDHLCDDSRFRIEVKSRQIAWSWLSAAEAVACAILYGQESIFVSYNQEEAKEKIRYAKQIYASLEGIRLPAINTENAMALEIGGARLLSLPASPPRGKARFRIYLDEFAHAMHDKEIYVAALPVTSRGGVIRIGSSPLGASGQFWEVVTEKLRIYPGYSRKVTPWWEVKAFCVNVPLAQRLAPTMETAQRVELFGRPPIQEIYANLLLEDFQQEYECIFVDETTAWISWDEIRAVQDATIDHRKVGCRGMEVGDALAAIGAVAELCATGVYEGALACGVDIGRTKNTTELYFVGLSPTRVFPLRLMITLDATPFDEQWAVAEKALTDLPLVAMLIDKNGLGMNLAENAERRFPTKAKGVDFTNATKALWATDAKLLCQQRRCQIPVDRDLAYQIHSIKKLITPAKNLVFDTDRNEKHHADKFWAWALSLNAANLIMHRPQIVHLAEDQVVSISPV